MPTSSLSLKTKPHQGQMLVREDVHAKELTGQESMAADEKRAADTRQVVNGSRQEQGILIKRKNKQRPEISRNKGLGQQRVAQHDTLKKGKTLPLRGNGRACQLVEPHDRHTSTHIDESPCPFTDDLFWHPGNKGIISPLATHAT